MKKILAFLLIMVCLSACGTEKPARGASSSMDTDERTADDSKVVEASEDFFTGTVNLTLGDLDFAITNETNLLAEAQRIYGVTSYGLESAEDNAESYSFFWANEDATLGYTVSCIVMEDMITVKNFVISEDAGPGGVKSITCPVQVSDSRFAKLDEGFTPLGKARLLWLMYQLSMTEAYDYGLIENLMHKTFSDDWAF